MAQAEQLGLFADPDAVKPKARTGRFTLRPYQQQAADAVYATWREVPRVLVVKATGLGKTVLFAEVSLRWPDEAGKILILAHRTELIEQAAEKVGLHLDERPEIEMAERKVESRLARVIVSSVQTQNSGRKCQRPECKGCEECVDGMIRRMQKFNANDFGLLIIDEGHHATSPSYRRVMRYYMRNPNLKVLLVTATPHRADRVGMKNVVDACAFEMGILEGVNDGWLVPIQQRYVVVEGLDFSKLRTVAGDFTDADIAKVMMGGVTDIDPADAEELKKQEKMLHEVVSPTVAEAGGRSTLVFAVTKEHARRLAEIFRRHPGVTADYLTDDTDPKERKEIINRFKRGQLQVLVSVGVLLEGFDAPNTAVVAVARPTKSKGLYTQIIGRGTRPLPGVVDGPETAEERKAAIAASQKPHLTVLDFVGNSGRHKLVSTADVLAGKALPEDVDAAVAAARESGEAVDIIEALAEAREKRLAEEERKRLAEEEAKRQAALAAEEARRRREQAELDEKERIRREIEKLKERQRKGLVADAQYRTEEIDPFGDRAVAPRVNPRAPGSVTDNQLEALRNLGVPEHIAKGYSKRQASKVIESMRERQKRNRAGAHPTPEQIRVLEAHCVPVPTTFGEAVQKIEEINRFKAQQRRRQPV